MKQKLFVYLMDEEAILYNQSLEILCTVPAALDKAHPLLEKHVKSTDILYLLLDQTHQDIHEEKLPSLFPWDLIGLLYHKKRGCAAQGGYGGFQVFRENKETYFRWAHILEEDPRALWVGWITSQFGHVFFVPLEGRQFLDAHISLLKSYQMLLYALPSQKIRHVIFKGKRLLLSRLSQREEDINPSLHFLSRTSPDIYDHLEIFSLNVAVTLSNTNIFPDPHAFLKFITSQKKPSFSLRPLSFSKVLWIRRSLGMLLTLSLLWMGAETYRTIDFKKKTISLLDEVKILKNSLKNQPSSHLQMDRGRIGEALAHYAYLKPYQHNPLRDIEQLASLLEINPVHLETLRWTQDKKREITLTFLMNGKSREALITQFDAFLAGFKTYFPGSQIYVLEAPYNSSPHETFKSSPEDTLPLASVKVTIP